MKKVSVLLLLLFVFSACGDGGTVPDKSSTVEQQNQTSDLNTENSSALANNFCSAQTRLQMVATGLLSAYSVKSNGSDLNYCGGEIILGEDNPDFDISINEYCYIFRDQQLTLNGKIIGAVESGANFTSEIPEITLVGDNVDLTLSGRTWDGRADDMFISLVIADNISGEDIVLDEVSIKKGELDFGYITFSDLDRIKFKFIEHFNAELTQGQLFFYGNDDELVIITADNGTITVVYKESKLDPGTLLEANCGA